MIRFFRNYHPAALVFLFVLVVILRLHILFEHTSQLSALNQTPLSKLFIRLVTVLPVSSEILSFILSVIITFSLAVIINIISNNYRLLSGSSYLSAFSFVLIISLISDFTRFNSVMLAMIFLLIMLDYVFGFYKKEKIFGDIFNTGFLCGMAMLFYTPMIVFSPFVFISLVVMRQFSWREWIVSLLGIGIPLYFAFTVFFLTDSYTQWFNELQNQLQFHSILKVQISISTIVLISIVSIPQLWSLINVRSSFLKLLVQTRLCYVLVVWFFICGLGSVFFQTENFPSSLIWIAIPACFGLSFFFEEFKKTLWSELFALSLLLTIIFFQYQSYIIK